MYGRWGVLVTIDRRTLEGLSMRFRLNWTRIDGSAVDKGAALPAEVEARDESAAREAGLKLLDSNRRSQFVCSATAIEEMAAH
jgi:hypothetical protein